MSSLLLPLALLHDGVQLVSCRAPFVPPVPGEGLWTEIGVEPQLSHWSDSLLPPEVQVGIRRHDKLISILTNDLFNCCTFTFTFFSWSYEK